MISLRKHIAGMDAVFGQGFLRACDILLGALTRWGPRAVPDLGDLLKERVAVLERELARAAQLGSLDYATEQVETELSVWADQAWQRHEENRRELSQILASVTHLAESMEDRDFNHGREISGLASRLRDAAKTSDLAVMRRSIADSAQALTECVSRMADEGQASLARLAAEVEGYRCRLHTSEMLSGQDPLTGLANRRRFDEQLAAGIRAARPFCLLMIDLNGFKAVNDRYGHLAGDELLKQFADELRSQFPQATIVSRWGGDEFAILLSSNLHDTEARVQRLQRWAVGDYRVGMGRDVIKISIEAAFGAVEWKQPETARDLLEKADRKLYESKQAFRMGQRARRTDPTPA